MFVFPTLQFNVANYREDENTFVGLLDHLKQQDIKRLRLATAYFNLPKQYIKSLLSYRNDVELLTSAPKANGFYRAGRVKKYIPGIYRVNEQKLLA